MKNPNTRTHNEILIENLIESYEQNLRQGIVGEYLPEIIMNHLKLHGVFYHMEDCKSACLDMKWQERQDFAKELSAPKYDKFGVASYCDDPECKSCTGVGAEGHIS